MLAALVAIADLFPYLVLLVVLDSLFGLCFKDVTLPSIHNNKQKVPQLFLLKRKADVLYLPAGR